MTQLAKNAGMPVKYGDLNDHPVLAAVKIYEGSAVGLQLSSGYARQLVATTDLDRFLGFAQAEADNALGASGDIRVRTLSRGRVKLSVTGVDGVNDIGKPVYASDGATFTTTQADDTVFIGYMVEHVTGAVCWVEFDANHNPQLTAIADVVPVASPATDAETKLDLVIAALRKAGIIAANT